MTCPHCGRDIPPRLSRADGMTLAKLLPAIAGVVGSEPFYAHEIVEHDSPALRIVRGDLTAKRLGRLLLRASRQSNGVAGFVVREDGKEVGVTLWRLLRVSS